MKTKLRFSPLLSVSSAVCAVLLSAVCAHGESSLASADEKFIKTEAEAGMVVTQTAQLAAKKATRTDVKAFADKLASEHATAHAELTQLAQTKGVALPEDANQTARKAVEKLSNETGADFDKAYLDQVVSDHEKCVDHFEKAASEAKDGDVKAWASKMLPTLQGHLKTAQELRKEETVSTAAADNTARNVRESDGKALTPLDQGNSQADIDITAKIRRQVVDVDGLSVNGQNVKIVTKNGRVTLRGPVDSAAEKALIGNIASEVATAGNVDNQLEVRAADAAPAPRPEK